jgi:hypothetical protein
MNIQTLEKIVPAAFAAEPAGHVSDRYSFIDSREIISKLSDRGFDPVKAYQSKRVSDPNHTTHMITFEDPKFTFNVGDVAPQVVLFNNHAASRRATLRAGLWRKACSNGLVVSVGQFDAEFSYIHKDGNAFNFDEEFNRVIEQLNHITDDLHKWMDIQLNFVQQQDFASKAVLIKNQNDPYWSKHFDAHEFLARRRDSDRGNDLWTIFNVVQENIMKGGVQGPNRITKPITQVAEVQRINEALWQLTTEYGNSNSLR